MTQKSLSSETCLGYLSALQVHAFCRRRGIALATTRHRHFPSKAASRRSGKRPHHPHVQTRTCLPAFQCRSTAFRQARQLQDPLNSASLTSADSPFRETPAALERELLLSSPSLAFTKKPPCVLSWTPLFSDSSYVAHTSRRPWQRRPYMAHNRLRACVKFVGSSSAIPVFLAPSEHVPQLHISSTAPLLPAKLKPRFS